MKLAAAKTSAGLSLLFLVVYCGTNWISAHRANVPSWYFDWELKLPFVPLMILPYMSIDLFFVAAPFLCRDRLELQTLARRITFAIIVAGVCFLLFPLKLAFTKPQFGGWLGAIFHTFLEADQPYNLLPSLHITLRTILADLYTRHTRNPLRLVLHLWFSLIGFSTVLIYQHHIVDVIGGFILAALCFYSFPATRADLPVTKNYRIARHYAAATAVAFALAIVTWPWGAILLWPGLSMSLVVAAYCGVGPRIFRKTNGRLPLSTKIILAPVLVGQYLSILYYRRQCRPWDEVAPRIWIGRRLDSAEAADAVDRGVTAVLDLTAEFSEPAAFRFTRYLNIPIMDLTAPTPEQLREAVKFIETESKLGIVYVHCKIGYSRSAAVVGAYLLASASSKTAEEAASHMRKVRPRIVIRPEAMQAMRDFA